MNLKRCLTGFVTILLLAFVVAAIVSFLYNLIAHGEGAVDWGHSVRLAIILGIVIPLVRELESKKPS